MTATHPARHLSISICRTPSDVYAFASQPENLPRWAAGLSGTIEFISGQWIADSPMGRVIVAFVEDNTLGVLDHVVTLPDGHEFLNPLRVFANGDGSEVVFTLFHLPAVDGAAFERDAALVGKDLATLKALLEAPVS